MEPESISVLLTLLRLPSPRRVQSPQCEASLGEELLSHFVCSRGLRSLCEDGASKPQYTVSPGRTHSSPPANLLEPAPHLRVNSPPVEELQSCVRASIRTALH